MPMPDGRTLSDLRGSGTDYMRSAESISERFPAILESGATKNVDS